MLFSADTRTHIVINVLAFLITFFVLAVADLHSVLRSPFARTESKELLDNEELYKGSFCLSFISVSRLLAGLFFGVGGGGVKDSAATSKKFFRK